MLDNGGLWLRLLNFTIAPNDTNFTQDLITGVGASVAQNVLQSGLWTVTDDFTVCTSVPCFIFLASFIAHTINYD